MAVEVSFSSTGRGTYRNTDGPTFHELVITDDAELAMLGMAPVTVDRWLAPDMASCSSGSGRIPSPGATEGLDPDPTWAEWDDAVPGFVEFDLVGDEGGHEVGTEVGEHCSWFPISGPPTVRGGARVTMKSDTSWRPCRGGPATVTPSIKRDEPILGDTPTGS